MDGKVYCHIESEFLTFTVEPLGDYQVVECYYSEILALRFFVSKTADTNEIATRLIGIINQTGLASCGLRVEFIE